MRLILLLLLSLNSFAANFVSPRIVDGVLPQAYELQKECERVEQVDCVDIANNPVKIYETYLNPEDDLTKPVYAAASNVTPCASEQACLDLFATLCVEPLEPYYQVIEGGFQAYCTRIVGYEPKDVTRIRISEAKQTLYQAELVLKAQAAAFAAADAQASKAMECGNSAQRLLLIRNASKTLTTAQIKSLVAATASMKALLDTGSLNSAQEEIAAFTADGVIITEADKTALIQHINGCK